MRALSDEVISCAAATVKTLSVAKFDPVGQSRAIRAVIYVHVPTSGDVTMGYRFGADPVSETKLFRPLAQATELVVEGFENILALRLLLVGDTTAKVFVQYFV